MRFGQQVVVLPNNNIVVTDPAYAVDTAYGMGAVYLYDGASRQLISRLTGAAARDAVGSGGVTVLPTGNVVVSSPNWSNGGRELLGAITWGDGTSGTRGFVSAANSLTGVGARDLVGSGGTTALSNGNYVVSSPFLNVGLARRAGAVTWGNGVTGSIGVVSSANSLVGSSDEDNVGRIVTALSNGNYVVGNSYWRNDTMRRAGAVTWGDGTSGTSGGVLAANSLVQQ